VRLTPQVVLPKLRSGRNIVTKRIILLLDGTWNDAEDGAADTNIVRLRQEISRCLAKPASSVTSPGTVAEQTSVLTGARKGGRQNIILYERGIGTGGFTDRFRGGAFGAGLDRNVLRAYTFLAQHYQPGDEIYIFGFSRGSYTARSLVGCIAAMGLIHRSKFDAKALSFVWAYYRTHPASRLPSEASRLKKISSGPGSVPIKILGLFDTVGALGIPLSAFWRENRDLYGFHDVTLSSVCEHSLQALSIDEHRAPFEATLWRRLPFTSTQQKVEQVWFAGAHADVGGGYINEETRGNPRYLDDITLEWMIRRVLSISGAGFPLESPEPTSDEVRRQRTTAPQHEPRRGIYRAMPYAYRSIGNKRVPVAPNPFERNACFSRHAQPVGEAIHVSAVERLGKTIEIEGGPARYAPRNLIAALQQDPAIPVIGWNGRPLNSSRSKELVRAGLQRALS
jgi:hypothetical protein